MDRRIMKKILHTENKTTYFILRTTIGSVMLLHAAQQIWGWFGKNSLYGLFGEGVPGLLRFGRNLGLTDLIVYLLIIIIVIGPLAIIIGAFTRASALGLFCLLFFQLSSFYPRHFSDRPYFFMEWAPHQDRSEGMEYHIIATAISFVLVMKGGGKWSVDKMIDDRIK